MYLMEVWWYYLYSLTPCSTMIPIYLVVAWLCYQAMKLQYTGWLYAICTVLYLTYAGYMFFTDDVVLSWIMQHDKENLVQTMKATKPWIEQTREFGGLLIVLFSMGLNWFYFRRKRT